VIGRLMVLGVVEGSDEEFTWTREAVGLEKFVQPELVNIELYVRVAAAPVDL
jgi:hypothetical protein